ncbi:flavin reductase family protein [Pandoraea bronchicola]|uniref:Nitrilotriacetate monooxygenase n=1 Tax=Pandoraea bronchicola TaxID=2508287 RepID=A0A5E5BXG9_9BURK|nr:flavin reductase family protein [Pandoraea bronchicola]VVE89822.1 nitrilotriacetate monooxygenase [Pandoraea bronchicola]
MSQMSTYPQEPAEFDTRKFRQTLGHFATGVTIITARSGDRLAGVTANSFNSVSLDPPLILWSINKTSRSFPVFRDASHFAVNVLASDQIQLSNRFARSSDDKFAGVAAVEGLGGCKLFEGVSATFQCEHHSMVDAGDHWIFLGKVVTFQAENRAPLLYHQGSYSMVTPHPDLALGV